MAPSSNRHNGPASNPGTRDEILRELQQLRQRLRELEAIVSPAAPAEPLPAEDFNVVVCRVGQERFGIRLDVVERAVMMCWLTPLPQAPPWVSGLLRLHGSLVPVLDLGARLKESARDPALSDYVVVCRTHAGTVGLVVEQIVSVAHVSTGEVRNTPAGLPQGHCLGGVLDQGGETTLLLDLPALLAASELPHGLAVC